MTHETGSETCPRDAAACRLAVYGTLAPGRPNHHRLDGLTGRWLYGYVHGTLVHAGWGASLGYPRTDAFPEGPAVDVQVFESTDLPAHWARLDEFEGPGYRRVVTTVHLSSNGLAASLYVLREQKDDHVSSRSPMPHLAPRPTRLPRPSCRPGAGSPGPESTTPSSGRRRAPSTRLSRCPVSSPGLARPMPASRSRFGRDTRGGALTRRRHPPQDRAVPSHRGRPEPAARRGW